MNARAYAFALLKEICIDEGYSNLLLRNKLQSVDPKDKALVTQIVYGLSLIHISEPTRH